MAHRQALIPLARAYRPRHTLRRFSRYQYYPEQPPHIHPSSVYCRQRFRRREQRPRTTHCSNHIENRYFMAIRCPESRIGVIHRTGAACCSTKVCEGLPVNNLVFINDFLPFGTRFWTIKMTQVATNRKLWKLDLFVCCVAFYLPCPLRSDRHIGSLMSK